MNKFAFHRPSSVADAVAALKQADEGKLLAGGQSLLPVMKLNLAAPSDLIAVGALKELRGIRVDGNRLIIGAAMTHAEVHASPEVQSAIPALAALAGGIGDPQVRNRGTLGGSIAHNDPAADYPAALVALKAEVKTDRRTIAAEDFFTGMFSTALEPHELVLEVSFVRPERAAYVKFRNQASLFAVVGVMVAKYPDGVRAAVVGAKSCVYRATAMEQALGKRFAADALEGITEQGDDFAEDTYASAEYRAHLVTVIAKRAVAAA